MVDHVCNTPYPVPEHGTTWECPKCHHTWTSYGQAFDTSLPKSARQHMDPTALGWRKDPDQFVGPRAEVDQKDLDDLTERAQVEAEVEMEDTSRD